MKGFIPIPLLIAIIVSVLAVSTGTSLYFHEQEKSLATVGEPVVELTESSKCPTCECPICEECPTCPESSECLICEECLICPEDFECPVCEPVEIIVEKEVIKEVLVETIVYQDKIIYQTTECLPCECEPEENPEIDTTPPQITWFTYYHRTDPDSCIVGQCNILMKTDEPSRAKVYYLDFNANIALQEAYNSPHTGDYIMSVLESEGSKSENLFLWDDVNFNTEHKFDYQNVFQPNITYFFRAELEDQSGNMSERPWSWGQQIIHEVEE